MRIPKQLAIGGRKIKVKFVEMEKGCVGKADFENGLILIKKDMKRSAQEATFVHEMFHHMNTTMQHSVLDSLAEQTYQAFKVNKLWK